MPIASSRRRRTVSRLRAWRTRLLLLERLEDRALPNGSPLSAAPLLTFSAIDTAHASGRIAAANGFDLYRVNLGAGDVVTAAVGAQASGSGLQSVLRVFDSAGRPLALDDQEGGDPRLTFQATTADAYFVGISSAGDDAYDPATAGSGHGGATTGMYALDLRRDPGRPLAADLAAASFRLTTETAAYGDTVSGTFTVENRGGADAAAFAVDAVLSSSNRFDSAASPHWAVANLTGLPAGEARSFNFTITLPSQPAGFPATGPLSLGLDLNAVGGQRGADWEALTIVAPVTASGANHSQAAADVLTDPNSRVSGTLTAGQPDWYQLSVSDAERLTARVAAVGGAPPPSVALFGPGGRLLIQSDAGQVVQPLQAGTYFLRVADVAGSGGYQLVSEVVPAGPPLDPLAVTALARSAVAADLNGDGRPELIVANGGPLSSPGDTVSVLLGNGDGTFQPQQTYAVGSAPNSVAVADVNGDGIPDLIVANFLSNTVSVLLGNGDGTFRPQQTFAVGAEPAAVAVADLDGDGRPDLVTANYGDGTVSVLLNQTPAGSGAAAFAPASAAAVGAKPGAVVVADVTGDGIPDVIATNYGADTVSVLGGKGDGTFLPQQTFAVGSQPIGLTVADLNGDGAPDVVTANSGDNTLSVLLGTGHGRFLPQQTFSVGNQPLAVSAADLNGDGTPDLVAVNFGSASVLLNETAAGATVLSFAPRPAFPVGGVPKTVAVADLTGDGVPDLVTANYGGGPPVSVLVGNGDGSFQTPQAFAIGSNALAVVAADVHRDGKADLVVANFGSDTVSVLAGNGDGTFQPQQTFAVGSHPSAVAVADLNGDGRPDIVVTDRGPKSDPGDTVSVLLGNGDGTFQPQQTYTVGSAPDSVVVADVNGDGIPDLIVANKGSGTVSVLLGNGDGTFRPQQTFAVGSSPYSIAVADLNGDGRPDIVAANYGDGTVSVLLNLTPADGASAAFSPQQVFAVGAGPIAVTAADVNGDGRPDVVTANYGAGSVSVLLNRTAAGGPPTFAPQETLAVGSSPTSVAVADLGGDGKPDLVVTDFGSASVSVLPGDGHGSFLAQQTIAAGAYPAAVAAADVNGDGRPDLCTVSDVGDTATVLLNRGDGTFTPPAQAVGFGLRDTPYRGDLNGDGTPDTVLLDRAGNILYRAGLPGADNQFAPPVVLNPGRPVRDIAVVRTGTGWAVAAADAAPDPALSPLGSPVYDVSLYTDLPTGFARAVAFTTARLPTRLVAGDLTGDGLDDLVVAGALDDSVTVALQTAAGTFVPGAALPVGVAPSDLALADVNGDGLRDIVVTDGASGDVTVLLNDPSHSFATAERFRAGLGPYALDTTSGAPAVGSLLQTVSVAAGDFTSDGRNDLLVVNRGAHSFTVLPDDGAGYADPAASRTISTSDGTAVNEQPGPVVAGDFNGDGNLDLAILMEDAAQVWVYAGDGHGHFAHTFSIAAGSLPTGLSAVRDPRTGRLDLLVGDQFGDVLELQGQGDGTFRPPPPLSGDGAPLDAQVLPGGLTAVLLADQQRNQVAVQTAAAGSAQFAPAAVLASGAQQTVLAPGAVKWYDLEGSRDPFPDAVVIGSGSNNVLVYRATGFGAAGQPTFAPPVAYPVGQDPVSVTVADVNGDGVPDLLVADRGSNDVAVLFGEYDAAGDWTARPGPRLNSGGQGPVAVAVRESTGDGVADLVVTNGQSGTFAVLPGVGQGFFNDQNPLILDIPGNPQVGPPSFVGSSGDGVVATADGRLVGFDLSDFAATVRTVFVPPPGLGVSAVGALADGSLVAAEEGGAVVLLEPGPGALLQAAEFLEPLTGIPSDPSALVVLEGQPVLQVLVTGAGQDRVYLFEPPSGSLLSAAEAGPSLPPLPLGAPTLVATALGEALAVGATLSGGLLFVPETAAAAPPAAAQPLNGAAGAAPAEDDGDADPRPQPPGPPSLDRAADSSIQDLLHQGEPKVSPDGAVPEGPAPDPAPPDDGAAVLWHGVPALWHNLPVLWHGLPTVPLDPTAGLLEPQQSGSGLGDLWSADVAWSGDHATTWGLRSAAVAWLSDPATARPADVAWLGGWERVWPAALALVCLPAVAEPRRPGRRRPRLEPDY